MDAADAPGGGARCGERERDTDEGGGRCCSGGLLLSRLFTAGPTEAGEA